MLRLCFWDESLEGVREARCTVVKLKLKPDLAVVAHEYLVSDAYHVSLPPISRSRALPEDEGPLCVVATLLKLPTIFS
jgi:hypothetical protein